MVGDDMGALEIIWRCSGFGVIVSGGARRARLLAPDGGLGPLLVLPRGVDARGREDACGMALARLFLGRYGQSAMLRTVRAWDHIAAAVGAEEEAAD